MEKKSCNRYKGIPVFFMSFESLIVYNWEYSIKSAENHAVKLHYLGSV